MDVWIGAALAVIALLALAYAWVRSAKRDERRPGVRPQVVCTQHAKERMAQRGISQAQLEHVVWSPQRHAFDPTQNSVRLERSFGDDVLKVWIVPPWPASDRAVVKSTAWRITRRFEVRREAVGRIIGPGGATVRALQDRTGTRISIRRDGVAEVSGGSERAVMRAIGEIRAL